MNEALKLTADSIVYAASQMDPSKPKEYEEGMKCLMAAMITLIEHLYPNVITQDSADWWKS